MVLSGLGPTPERDRVWVYRDVRNIVVPSCFLVLGVIGVAVCVIGPDPGSRVVGAAVALVGIGIAVRGLWMRVEISEWGVRNHRLLRNKMIPWSDVSELDQSSRLVFGLPSSVPVLKLSSGREIAIDEMAGIGLRTARVQAAASRRVERLKLWKDAEL